MVILLTLWTHFYKTVIVINEWARRVCSIEKQG